MRILPSEFSVPATSARAVFTCLGLAVLAAALVALINPIGYVGAGADDEKYLDAARCWIASGHPCVPTVHWSTRWPAFAPIALFTWLFGESRLSVGIGPAIAWLGALGLTGWLGGLWFGWRAGAIALVLLGAIPIVAASAFDPNVDLPELAFQAATLVAATLAYRRQSRALTLLAGLTAGLALQARDTSALFLLASGIIWLTLDASRRRILLWAIPALAGTMAAEMAVYAFSTGEPLWRYRLALGHTNIASFELPDDFHSSRGPLLNPDYMQAWKREAQVTLWWPIDPWLNLLASSRSAVILFISGLSFFLFRKDLARDQGRSGSRLLAGAVIVALMLVYVLAIDPKPRMFMSLWAALALIAGALLAAGLRSPGRLLAVTLVGLSVVLGVQVMMIYPASAGAERRAAQWIASYGQDIELDQGAASYLTLLPEARKLAPRRSGRRYLVATSRAECSAIIDVDPVAGPNGRVVDSVSGSVKKQGYLCLFEYLPSRPSVQSGRLSR